MTKILVIEDENSIRETIIDSLEFADYEVDSATNGLLGVQVAKSFQPDLILCDVMMPELDGYGVLLELSQDVNLSRVPFIFLTAKATKEDMRRGMALGADDYLTKPFTSQELLEAVKVRLERHQQIQTYNTQQMEFVRQYINLTLPHELRTPLSGIMGYMYMLEDGFEDMDANTIRDMIGAINRASNRLGHLIENYIAYGQVQLMRNDPELISRIRKFSIVKDFHSLAYQTAETVSYDASRMDDVQIDLEPVDAHIFFDHAKKLLSEIFSNAFKFSKAGSPVIIQGHVEDNSYVLSVSDKGRGMTQEQIQQVSANNQFERETYEQQGAGLGLVISQHIIAIYEGELIVESEPQAGTTIHIILQLA